MQENRTEYKSMLSKEHRQSERRLCSDPVGHLQAEALLWASLMDGSNHWFG